MGNCNLEDTLAGDKGGHDADERNSTGRETPATGATAVQTVEELSASGSRPVVRNWPFYTRFQH